MVQRKKISASVETLVLSNSRRRCCVCYALNRDTKIKQGQIAHLDQNPSNNTEFNLAFLCFDHHDQYDSKTRQSKNITKEEITLFRNELYNYIAAILKQPVTFGEATLILEEKYAGDYEREGDFESATIAIEYIGKGYVQVSGFALWGKTNKYGPNIGEIAFLTKIEDEIISYTHSLGENTYKITIAFQNGKLIVAENYEPTPFGYFGMNVSFTGEYNKIQYS